MENVVRAADEPFAVEVEAGETYFWCSCGRSADQPFCDGSHQGTGLSPQRYQPTESGRVFFCGCKATASAPLCDGSHRGG